MQEEIEIKETVVVEEVFVDGQLVEEQLDEVIEVEIDGKTHRWEKKEIKVHEIAKLGGWAVAEGVLLIDADNNERTLAEHEVIVIEVGIAFAKKVRFRRG
jgi:hypothetical protein